MTTTTFTDSAQVLVNGQVILPKKVREVLGVSSGDHVTFIVEDHAVYLANTAIYAMQVFQKEMAGEAKRAGLTSEDEVVALVEEMRKEDRKA